MATMGKNSRNTLTKLRLCSDEEGMINILRSEKIWKVTFKEMEDLEDRVPGNGWCGYLAIDQVRRGSDIGTRMDVEGTKSMIHTIDELVKVDRNSVV